MENKEMQAAPKKGVIRRIIRTLFSFYPVLMPVVLFCILSVSYTHLTLPTKA